MVIQCEEQTLRLPTSFSKRRSVGKHRVATRSRADPVRVAERGRQAGFALGMTPSRRPARRGSHVLEQCNVAAMVLAAQIATIEQVQAPRTSLDSGGCSAGMPYLLLHETSVTLNL